MSSEQTETEDNRLRRLEERIQQLELWQETQAREYSNRIRELERWKASQDGVVYMSTKEQSVKSVKLPRSRLDSTSPKNSPNRNNYDHFFQSFNSDKYDYDVFISYRRGIDDDVSSAVFYSLSSGGIYQGDVFYGKLVNKHIEE